MIETAKDRVMEPVRRVATSRKIILALFEATCNIKVAKDFKFGTNLEQFDYSDPAQNRGRSRAWRLHPTSGLSVQDACDSKSQKASVLILWTFSEGNAPMSLASIESLRLRTRLSCGARFTEKTQRTLCGGFYG